MSGLNITSEIGRLKTIILHQPGEEIRRMPPALRLQLLFDDILYPNLARREHEAFKKLMTLVTPAENVYEMRDLLVDVLGDEVVRRQVITDVCLLDNVSDEMRYALLDLEPQTLADTLLGGCEKPGNYAGLRQALDHNPYSLPPIPNMMFMRDPAIVVGQGVLLGQMYWPARRREPLLMRYIFTHHDKFAAGGAEPPLWFDRLAPEQLRELGRGGGHDPFTVEGGDVLVVRPDLLLIGCSERTSAEGIDLLASELRRRGSTVQTIYAVIMPRQRRVMHLDTVFTF